VRFSLSNAARRISRTVNSSPLKKMHRDAERHGAGENAIAC
jgi:hypothetical protein